MQKRASGGAGVPQLGQRCSSWAPQDMQKRAPAGFSVPHAAQLISREYSGAPGRLCDARSHFIASRQPARVAVGRRDVRQQRLVDQRQPAPVHLEHGAGPGRVPEGAQLARRGRRPGAPRAAPRTRRASRSAPRPGACAGAARRRARARSTRSNSPTRRSWLLRSSEKAVSASVSIGKRSTSTRSPVSKRSSTKWHETPQPIQPLEDGHVVAADTAEVGQRRGVEVQAADPPERDQRLADPVPEQERDDHVHIRRRVRVELVLAHQREPVAAGGQVEPLRRACGVVGRRAQPPRPRPRRARPASRAPAPRIACSCP